MNGEMVCCSERSVIVGQARDLDSFHKKLMTVFKKNLTRIGIRADNMIGRYLAPPFNVEVKLKGRFNGNSRMC